MSSTNLPPKPDTTTGEPSPPEAPLLLGPPEERTRTLEGFGEAPPGRGPILETHRNDRRAVALSAIVAALAYIVILYVHEGDWTWLKDPIHWVLISLLIAIMLFWGGTAKLAAGADWLRVKRRWVDVYNLTRVDLRGPWLGWMLRLKDSEGRRVRTYMSDLEPNRHLWALVYNGMAHSVVNGAKISHGAEGALHLRKTPDGQTVFPAHQPKVPQKVSWSVLGGLVAAFALIAVIKPEWAGPSLAIFAGVTLFVLIPAFFVFVRIDRRRQRQKYVRGNSDGDSQGDAKHRL